MADTTVDMNADTNVILESSTTKHFHVKVAAGIGVVFAQTDHGTTLELPSCLEWVISGIFD